MRFRHIYMGLGGLLVILILLLSDPDIGFIQNLPFGSSTVSILIILLLTILYAGMLHITRKALFDYIDLSIYFKKALQTPEGAGLALVAVGLSLIAISILFLAAVK